MKKYSKKVWNQINMIYRYRKYFSCSQNQPLDNRSSIPKVLLENNRICLYSGKVVSLFKVRGEISGSKFGELLFTRKYRPAKYRKSKKKNKWVISVRLF